MRRWLTLVLAFMSIPAFAATALHIDDIAGVYKHRHVIEIYDVSKGKSDSPVAEDVVEIVKIASGEAYVRARLAFVNGHTCSFHGIAKVEANALVYRTKVTNYERARPGAPMTPVSAECVLSLTPDHGRLLFSDLNNICRTDMWGARGAWDGAGFDLKSRRAIRYMPRLLASREYREAMQTREASP